jgi:hypothetical protein
MSITVLEPTARSTVGATALNPRPESVAGLTVGLLDNGKPNSDVFLAAFARELTARGALPADVVRKGNIGRLAEPELLAKLAANSDLVVVGVGDCAGCCSCSTLDTVALEAAGRPTVMVCTTEFLTTARISAATAGVRDYPFSVIDHPFGALTAEQVAERAADVARELWGPAA